MKILSFCFTRLNGAELDSTSGPSQACNAPRCDTTRADLKLVDLYPEQKAIEHSVKTSSEPESVGAGIAFGRAHYETVNVYFAVSVHRWLGSFLLSSLCRDYFKLRSICLIDVWLSSKPIRVSLSSQHYRM